MKFARMAMVLMSVLIMASCSNKNELDENQAEQPSNDEVSANKVDTDKTTDNEDKVTGNNSTELPVTIYRKEKYDLGADTFVRTIDSVTVRDFTEEDEIEFIDRYGQEVQTFNVDFINDYKLVEIEMSHYYEENETEVPREAYILDKNSEILYNDEPITDETHEIVAYQVKSSTRDFKMKSERSRKGNIIYAIPLSYLDGKLQLKTVSRDGDDTEYLYINLNN